MQVSERVNPTPTDGTALSRVTGGPKPSTPVISSSDGGRGSPKDINGHNLHKTATSANISANTEASTNTLQRSLCAPPACVNTACSPAPREDGFSPTSKGYISLSSAPNCAPPACVNTVHSPGLREDAFSFTSKGYLSTSLYSTFNGQSATVSHSYKSIGTSSATSRDHHLGHPHVLYNAVHLHMHITHQQ